MNSLLLIIATHLTLQPCEQVFTQTAAAIEEKVETKKPYLSEYHGQGLVIMFHGEIKSRDEAKVRVLQTEYLESLVLRPDRLYSLEAELNRLGIKITQIDADPFINSERAFPYFPPGDQK